MTKDMFKLIVAFLTVSLVLSSAFVPQVIGQSGGGPQSVRWVNEINCTANSGSLQKTGGLNDTADAAARSQQLITAGDAYLEFAAGQNNKLLYTGLTHAAIGTDFTEIDFAIKLTDFGVAEVRENEVYKTEIPYNPGDTFRVADESGTVKYYHNGDLLYASQQKPEYPLIADAVIVAMNAHIDNAVIGALGINAAAEWPMFQRDPAHSGFATASNITTSNVSNLNFSWNYRTGAAVNGTPIVSGGMVYAGSEDGKMYAVQSSDGSPVWSFTAGQVTDSCGTTYGIDSTAAIANGTLYFGAANGTLYAVNASTGNLIWSKQLADGSRGWHLRSSPLVFEGKIYVGLSSHCSSQCVRGSVVCVSASDGSVLWQTFTAPDGSTGAGVSSSLAVDPERRLVFATTGGACAGGDTYANSILALNADSGNIAWQFQNMARGRSVTNLDFVASPVLFDVSGIPSLAVGSKDGFCYAVRRDTGELLWQTQVTDSSNSGGILSSAAAADGKIYLGAQVQGQTGKVVALEQKQGDIIWQESQPAPVVGAAAVTNSMVFIGGGDGTVRAYDETSGASVWSVQRGGVQSGVSVTSDSIYFGSNDRSIYAFQLNAVPRLSLNVTSPTSGTRWLKGQQYDVTWSVTGNISRVDISLSRDGGTTWTQLAGSVDASLGTFRVKAKKPKSTNAVIMVSDSGGSGISSRSATFTIGKQ